MGRAAASGLACSPDSDSDSASTVGAAAEPGLVGRAIGGWPDERAAHHASSLASGRELVWYVSYGSNMLLARLSCYLVGGTPPGARRAYPGCRDRRPPRRTVPVTLPGTVYFALESTVWTGGMAFYDSARPGESAARAYLLTAGQFADVAAQEMHRLPDGDLDLAPVLANGRARLGPGRYETLLLVGHRDGYPMLTFTAPWRASDVRPTAPSAAYLTMLIAGLREAHGWGDRQIADYLSTLPGARGTWRSEDVERLAAAL